MQRTKDDGSLLGIGRTDSVVGRWGWGGVGGTEASSQPRAGGLAAELLWDVSRSKSTPYPGESPWLESDTTRLSSHAQRGAYAILLL